MYERYDNAVNLYLDTCETNGCSAETIKNYRNIFRFYREFLEANSYEDASAAATVGWAKYLSPNDDKKKVSYRTLDMYLRVLSYLSDFSFDLKIYDSPFVHKKMFPKKKLVSKERNKEYNHVLTMEQIKQLIFAEKYTVEGKRTPRTFLRQKAMVTMFLTSGMRNIELRNLTMNNLHWDTGTIYLEITKGNKPRWVPFPEEAQDALNAYLNSGLRPANIGNDAPLFGVVTHDGEWRPFERTELSDQIERYVSSILGDEDGSRTHALRHAFASVSLTEGNPMGGIKTVLGHSNVATTAIYAKNLEPERTASNFGKTVSNMLKEGAA